MGSAVYYPPANDLYVFGGSDPVTGVNSAATRVYDIATNTWSAGPNMPDVRSFMASGYNPGNGKIYLVGGYSTATSHRHDQTWEFDPVAHLHQPGTAPARARCRLRGHQRPPLPGRRPRCRQHHARPHLRLRHRRQHLDAAGRHAGRPNNVPAAPSSTASCGHSAVAIRSGQAARPSRPAGPPPRTRRPRS